MLSPRCHSWSTHGPVPIGLSSGAPPVASRCSSGWMPKGVKAAMASNAGTGVHMVNTTSYCEVASILEIEPP